MSLTQKKSRQKQDFKLNFDHLLKSSSITPKNLKDFNNPNFNKYSTKWIIIKYSENLSPYWGVYTQKNGVNLIKI